MAEPGGSGSLQQGSSTHEARLQSLENSAVRISLWLGGVGLACIKGVAYYLSGSSLVRAAMFESLGDVVSSAIMTVTQWKVADDSDRHLYPAGKQRLTPLGILFFCAFMSSAMVSAAVDSVSSLTSPVENAESAEELLRRVFDEQPRLGTDLSPEKVEGIISLYGSVPDSDLNTNLVVALLAVCVLVKGVCYCWCLHVSKTAKSQMAATLGVDHRNDTISNFAIILVVLAVSSLEARGCNSLWVSKIDPAATLIMSLWILWCWVENALEQVKLLSNRRVEDQEEVKRVAEAAVQHLEGTLLRLHRADVYHCGESFEARLEVFPRSATELSVETISSALQELELAMCDADVGVHKAHAKLKRPRSGDAMDASWVAGYATP